MRLFLVGKDFLTIGPQNASQLKSKKHAVHKSSFQLPNAGDFRLADIAART
jgi:hypothetical protein